jgi:hypothetical protein
MPTWGKSQPSESYFVPAGALECDAPAGVLIWAAAH